MQLRLNFCAAPSKPHSMEAALVNRKKREKMNVSEKMMGIYFGPEGKITPFYLMFDYIFGPE